jgi:peptidoglycan lytic transglycosylase G
VRRPLALLVVVAIVAIGAFAVTVWIAGGEDEAAPAAPPTTTGPPPIQRLKIIFPEGFTVRDMADRVAAVRQIAIDKRHVTPRLTRQAYLRAVNEAVPPPRFRKNAKRGSLEGFLFPASYEFTQASSARELVSDQLRAFRERFGEVDLRYARSKNLTPYDVLIIASMIEKETAVPRERRLVAAVIYNRLRNRMPLGIDATIRYGLDIPGTESLTKAALRSGSPYNTRLRPGLPPTPIANPGLASIRAAANPARNVDYLYYVRKPKSLAHYFTASESDFLRKVCEYGYACN